MPLTNLPVELLPQILQHFVKPKHLASHCLVNKIFYAFAAPILYERVFIFAWHKNSKAKVLKLFGTLAGNPSIAQYVKRLVIRDFPKVMIFSDVEEILRVCLIALHNCVNLQSCTWTRDGSLNSAILEALSKIPRLQELEINGNHGGRYDLSILAYFTHLRKLSLIMPSSGVITTLSSWIGRIESNLQSLTLICKSSGLVTDTFLATLAPNLNGLEYLNLTGCPKVSEHGILALLSKNTAGIVGLGLEGLSPRFNMAEFAHQCSRTAALTRLRSITLTVQPQTKIEIWALSVVNLLDHAPLEIFQIYSSGEVFEATIPDDFWAQIVTSHGARLVRLSVHRMRISIIAINDICQRCTSLEQLFVVVDRNELDAFGSCLTNAKKLRAIHVNFPLEGNTDTVPLLPKDDALALASKCSTITQFGCNTRVWQVERHSHLQDGQVNVEACLLPYESLDIPEQFLVVRA